MKFSEKWLREWVDPSIDTIALCEQLTMAGLEVDSVEPACSAFNGVVVAEVKAITRHPDADKLKVCSIDDGNEELTIVCGAPNVYVGMKSALAKPGAMLPGIPELKTAELRGVFSHGMLCSSGELGLGDDREGIIELSADAELGRNLNEILDTNDHIIEISVTPNRGDCLSIQGIAREVAVLNQMRLRTRLVKPVKAQIKDVREVILSAPDACPRYCGRIIENINANLPAPLWMVERLRRSGIRSINVIVDITNYVLLELGQPMHAFNNDRLQNAIDVRYAKSQEKISLLDKKQYGLNQDTLLITDASGPLAMAGIMGGLDSMVNADTRNIFLESAFFTPKAIIGKPRQYGLHTDSSRRFERGVDPQLQRHALEYATTMIMQLCGGKPGLVTELKDDAHLPKNPPITLRKERIHRVLGIKLEDSLVSSTFDKLEMDCKLTNNQYVIKAPSYRFDINIEADLIGELIRIYGYDNVNAKSPMASLKIKQPNKLVAALGKIRATLINRDYQEIISYSFVDQKLNNLLNNKENQMLLANPISAELTAMRISLWPGLLSALRYNLKRQQSRVRLFETGLIFKGQEGLHQESYLGGLICGNRYNKHWDINDISCDLYDVKMDLYSALEPFLDISIVALKSIQHNMLHPGQAAEILINGRREGVIGQLHPRIRAGLDIPNNVYLFEININCLLANKKIEYQNISRYPSIARDIAIVIDEQILLADIVGDIKKSATHLLANLELFDLYLGKGIEKGKKSLAFSLIFQANSSTLIDGKVNAIMNNVIASLNSKFGATLRE